MGKCEYCRKKSIRLGRKSLCHIHLMAAADKEQAALQNKTNDGGRNGDSD